MAVILRDCYYCHKGIDRSQWHVHVKYCKSRTSKYIYPFNWGKPKIVSTGEMPQMRDDKDFDNENELTATHNANEQHNQNEQIFKIPMDITNCTFDTLQYINEDVLDIIQKKELKHKFNTKFFMELIQQHDIRDLRKHNISFCDGGPGVAINNCTCGLNK
eukprot:67023_1